LKDLMSVYKDRTAPAFSVTLETLTSSSVLSEALSNHLLIFVRGKTIFVRNIVLGPAMSISPVISRVTSL
jgi:hypothetical protein